MLPDNFPARRRGYKTYLGQMGIDENAPGLYAMSPYYPIGQLPTDVSAASPVFMFKAGRTRKFSHRADNFANALPYGFYILAFLPCAESLLRQREIDLFNHLKSNGCLRRHVPHRTEMQREKGEWFGGTLDAILDAFVELQRQWLPRKKMYLTNMRFPVKPECKPCYFQRAHESNWMPDRTKKSTARRQRSRTKRGSLRMLQARVPLRSSPRSTSLPSERSLRLQRRAWRIACRTA